MDEAESRRCSPIWAFSSGLVALLLVAASGPAAAAEVDCLACHGEKELRSEQGASLFVDADKRAKSAHGSLSCSDCHAGLTDGPHEPKPPKVECSSCHDDAAAALEKSVHGRRNGGGEAPVCSSCHGDVHEFVPRSDPGSQLSRRNLPKTCGACHANPEFLARHHLGLARPIEAYERSVHGRALARGNDKAASCSDCHGATTSARRRTPRPASTAGTCPATCGQCHTEMRDAFSASIHGQAVARGLAGAPVCTDCHGEHAILAPAEPGSLVNPARVSSVTCGRCHGDERLVQKYNLPKDKVPAFEDSFHGLAGRAGSQTRRQLRVLPRRPQHPAVERPALDRASGEPREDLRRLPSGRRRALRDRAGPRHERDAQRARGGALRAHRLPDADPGDARLHAAAQRPRLPAQAPARTGRARLGRRRCRG